MDQMEAKHKEIVTVDERQMQERANEAVADEAEW
jgi:hypothetical protein